jgi:predicted phage-related endonuclease
MHYPHKPHFKIFSSVVLGLLQYFLLNHTFEITHDDRDEMIAFGILTLNSLVAAVVVGSTAYDIRKQFKSKIKDEIIYLQREAARFEHQVEKFEHVVLDEATLLLGAKVYRTNPILNQYE